MKRRTRVSYGIVLSFASEKVFAAVKRSWNFFTCSLNVFCSVEFSNILIICLLVTNILYQRTRFQYRSRELLMPESFFAEVSDT